MSTFGRLTQPLTWTAECDPQVAEACARQRDLFDRASVAQMLAREASEAAASASAEHARARAAQLAEGGSDLGAFDSNAVDAAVSSASETAEALGAAAQLARQRALEVAEARAPEWAAAAQRKLDTQRAALLKQLDGIGPTADAYAAAWSELAARRTPMRACVAIAARLQPAPSLDAVRKWASTPPLQELVARQAQDAAAQV